MTLFWRTSLWCWVDMQSCHTSEVEVRSANERRLSQLQVANLTGKWYWIKEQETWNLVKDLSWFINYCKLDR